MVDPRLFFLTVGIFLQNTEKVLPGCTVRWYLHSEKGVKHMRGGFCLCMFPVIQTSLLPRQDFGTQSHFKLRTYCVTLISLETEKRKKPESCWEFGMMQKNPKNKTILQILWDCWWWYYGVDRSCYCYKVFVCLLSHSQVAQDLFTNLLKIYCTSNLLGKVILGYRSYPGTHEAFY